MKNERYNYIDILKGIGIILVVLGHLNPNIYLEKWIYSFHMFLFFFLSGYVFKKKSNLKKQLRQSAKSLLLPYIFWNGIAIIYSLVIEEYTLIQGIKKMFFYDAVSWNSPVWFLVVLFWSRVFYQFLSEKKYILIPTMWFMIVCSYYGIFNDIPFGINILPNAIIFFGIGILLSKVKISNVWCILSIPVIIISIVTSQLNNRISMYGNYFGNYFFSLIAGVSGVVGIFLIIRFLAKPVKIFDFLKKIGEYSMNVMCTHYFLLRLFQALSIRFLGGYDIWHAEGFVKAILVTVVVFIIEIFMVKALQKLKISNSHIMRI